MNLSEVFMGERRTSIELYFIPLQIYKAYRAYHQSKYKEIKHCLWQIFENIGVSLQCK